MCTQNKRSHLLSLYKSYDSLRPEDTGEGCETRTARLATHTHQSMHVDTSALMAREHRLLHAYRLFRKLIAVQVDSEGIEMGEVPTDANNSINMSLSRSLSFGLDAPRSVWLGQSNATCILALEMESARTFLRRSTAAIVFYSTLELASWYMIRPNYVS